MDILDSLRAQQREQKHYYESATWHGIYCRPNLGGWTGIYNEKGIHIGQVAYEVKSQKMADVVMNAVYSGYVHGWNAAERSARIKGGEPC